MRMLILSMTALAGACAPTPREAAQIQAREATEQEGLANALAGRVAGKPVDCVNQFQSRGVKAFGATILYTAGNGVIYRNETSGGCGNLGRDVLVTRTPSTSLCRGDIAQTVDLVARFPTGSCSFGEFVPYRKP